jgi:hypothetical protein
MERLRKEGWLCAVVEKWNPHVGPHGIRQDLFGFVDVLAISAVASFSSIALTPVTMAIQCCAASGAAAHVDKIIANENAPKVLAAGWSIEVWAWRKGGPKGKRKTWGVVRYVIGPGQTGLRVSAAINSEGVHVDLLEEKQGA